MFPKFNPETVFNTSIGMVVGTLIVMPLVAYIRGLLKV